MKNELRETKIFVVIVSLMLTGILVYWGWGNSFCISTFVLAEVIVIIMIFEYDGGASSPAPVPTETAFSQPMVSIYALMDGEKCFYIGQSIDPDQRLRQHKRSGNPIGTRKEKYIAAMPNSNSIRMIILASSRSKTEANQLEAKYTRQYGIENSTNR